MRILSPRRRAASRAHHLSAARQAARPRMGNRFGSAVASRSTSLAGPSIIRTAAHALNHSRVEPTAKWPPRRVREAPPEPTAVTEAVSSGVISGGRAGVTHERSAEPVFIGHDTLGVDLPVDRNYRRVPPATSQRIKNVVEPRLDPNFNMGQGGGNPLDQANGKVALLADGVRHVEEQLPAGHWIDGHDGRGLSAT